MSYTYIDNNQFKVVLDETGVARPVCPKCQKPMQFIDAHYMAYGDAAYWECDRNTLDCSHDDIVILWHSDVQSKRIVQLESENARLQARVVELEAMLAMLDNPDMAGMAWDAIEVLKLDSYPETDYQAVRKLLELGYVYSEDTAIVSYLGCGAWMKSE